MAATGPASSASTSSIAATALPASPAISARSIGAAPRQRGSAEGCRFTNGTASSSGRGTSRP